MKIESQDGTEMSGRSTWRGLRVGQIYRAEDRHNERV